MFKINRNAQPQLKHRVMTPQRALFVALSLLALLAASHASAQDREPAFKQNKQNRGAKQKIETPRLGLADFLTQVQGGNESYKAADWTARGARLQSAEGHLITRPNLTADASAFTLGEHNPLNETSTYRADTYSLGLSELTDFGLSAKATLNRAQLSVAVPGINGGYTTSWTQIELSQSLWRNWAGRETRAMVDSKEAGALANSFNQSYLTKTILLDAESTYWRLALAREQVEMNQEAVSRADKLVDWASRRARLELADRAESLQSSTALQARKLDFRTAQDNERAAAQAFNSARGINSDVVTEQLADLSEINDTMPMPTRRDIRDDVRAAQMQAKASAAAATLGREANKPKLEIYASTPVVPPADPPAQFASIIPPTSQPGTTLGVRFSAPLWIAATNNIREGYNLQASAADAAFQRKNFEGERDWADLVSKFTQAKARLSLYRDLEKQQREKLTYERERQSRGRSTMQTVLLYETDYQLAQQGLLSTMAELLTLHAQMKLYGATYESR